LTSLTTNGTKLDRMIANMPIEKIRRLQWIGIDIDAGTQNKYEQIRRSINAQSPFNQVINNATELVKMGATVDLKALINQYNNDANSLEELFVVAKQVNSRLLYLRPTILNGRAFDFAELLPIIDQLSIKYSVSVKLNFTKSEPRTYTKCHQMYQFPVFCADGKVYTCCDNKGNSRFALGSWDIGDFRDLWLSDVHHKIYNGVNTTFCPHCRPNSQNNKIQSVINNPALLEELYT
jgi:molybdenum cofactor biosynthesis enzyme MoaA